MVRSVPADAGDSYLCMLLAHAAAHGAMAGYTGFTVGLVKNKSVMIPIPELARTSPRSMNARGRTWERVVAVTNQPCAVARKEVLTHVLELIRNQERPAAEPSSKVGPTGIKRQVGLLA